MKTRFLSALVALTLAGAGLAKFSVVGAEEEQTPQTTIKIFLPKNPVAAAYLLRRYSNAELVRIERSEPVYRAMLDRQGIDAVYRQEALRELAKLHETDVVKELLAAVTRVDQGADDGAGALRDLAQTLAGFRGQQLAPYRADLQKLATDAKRPVARQIGYTGLILADNTIDEAWTLAGDSPSRQSDLLESLAALPNVAMRESSYRQVQELIATSNESTVRSAAIRAAVAIPNHDAETFELLANLIQTDKERDAAIAGMLRLPRSNWIKAQVGVTALALLDAAQKTPADQRTSEGFRSLVQLGNDLAALLPAEEAKRVRDVLDNLGVRMISLRAVPHQMQYDRAKIYVEAGKPVEIVFENTDIMPHNIVITEPGAMAEVGIAAERMQTEPDAVARHFIPESPKVLHAMRQLQPYETDRLYFTAPKKPGDYSYICTFPGHWRRMFGVMHVVADLDAVPAEELNPEPVQFEVRRFVRSWTMADLAPHLSEAEHGRSFENGQKLFAAISCATCHRMRGQGGQIGPELTEVFRKKNYTRETLLREILEPSHKIDDQFKTQIIVTKDGTQVAGVIVQQDNEAVYLIRNPLEDCEPIRIVKADIDEQAPAKVSIMPEGLLNTMTQAEIFDLLAYVESGGNASYSAFRE